MKTLKTILSFLLVACCISVDAQVTVEKTKSTLTGKNDLLATSIPNSMLDHFNINFYNYFMGSDAGGNNAKGNYNSVTVEATLENLDNQLAQEITDEAYLYFLDQWKSRGITITCPAAADIESSKQFAKDKSKGKAELINPGAYTGGNQYAKYVTIIPSNTVQVKKEYYGTWVYGNSQFFPPDFKSDISSVNFHLDVNFISFKSGIGTTASISGTAGLKSNCGASLVLWAKTKNLAAGYANEGNGGSEFYDSFDKGTPWKIKINREKYKAQTLELIKKSIDSMFAEYDENVSKAKK